MPTYAQLRAERWWDREIVTPAMDWLGDELCRRTGRPRTAAGTKGDNAHLCGAHRSQEWILRSRYCTDRDYRVQPGLTADQLRWVSGFDFTPGSAGQMIAQSRRLMAAMKLGRLDEVLEFYGNVDGDRAVDGWDNLRDRAARSDRSHLWHWHLSIDRRYCDKRDLMERILATALGDAAVREDEMSEQAESQINSLFDGMFHGGNSMGRSVDPDGSGERTTSNSVVAKLDYLLARLDAVERRLAQPVQATLDPATIAAALPAELVDRIVDELAARLRQDR
ncbi:hypothetical protein V6U90_24015 [Micromonospora sp. CPCC 206060]|uniref:hypothetical protein n=1 Tax=Micromonospora sp. CPCC 206060 TaxID=3122406 RepID=UPI002FF3BF83